MNDIQEKEIINFVNG